MAQVENILTKIERLILDANNTNTSDDSGKGTGDDRDKILMEDSINWKYKDVFPKFKLKDGTPEFSYHLLDMLSPINKQKSSLWCKFGNIISLRSADTFEERLDSRLLHSYPHGKFEYRGSN